MSQAIPDNDKGSKRLRAPSPSESEPSSTRAKKAKPASDATAATQPVPAHCDHSLNSELQASPNSISMHAPIDLPHDYWRAHLCDLLGIGSDVDDGKIIDAKKKAQEVLQKQHDIPPEGAQEVLQGQIQSTTEATPEDRKYVIIFEVKCGLLNTTTYYSDEPLTTELGLMTAHLIGLKEVKNIGLFLQEEKEVSFVVYRSLACCRVLPHARYRIQSNKPCTPGSYWASSFVGEYISIASEELAESMEKMVKFAFGDLNVESKYLPPDLVYPYRSWFHRRHLIKKHMKETQYGSRRHLEAVEVYIRGQLQDEWDEVDALIANQKITADLMHYVFVPNTILLSKSEGSKPHQRRCVKALGWLEISNFCNCKQCAIYPNTIRVGSWTFQGSFSFQEVNLSLSVPKTGPDGSFCIQDLSLSPLEYAEPKDVDALRSRGQMFWECRAGKYVSWSQSADSHVRIPPGSRFMVDYKVHQQVQSTYNMDVDCSEMDFDDEPFVTTTRNDHNPDPDPSEEFLLCLPTKIQAFNMQSKKWTMIYVGFIENVTWNKDAFERLAIDDGTKDLVQAVVTTHFELHDNTDLIHGKGNGLFILLHGGPGTGKTLTAESVAEVTERPLYKVTCGDIGTEATKVEKYLNEVLLLGRAWGCVVLLDEADVFLQARSIDDLDRNALVSVFLRVLEYYDGILILTSNRVATLDEGFKSRIQLSLGYPNLDEPQRLKIWTNFVYLIESLEKEHRAKCIQGGTVASECRPGIDGYNIRRRIRDLAKTKLNGREIRNIMSTARQLAFYSKEELTYVHILKVMDEAEKFKEYLKEVNHGHDDDDIMRAGNAR